MMFNFLSDTSPFYIDVFKMAGQNDLIITRISLPKLTPVFPKTQSRIE